MLKDHNDQFSTKVLIFDFVPFAFKTHIYKIFHRIIHKHTRIHVIKYKLPFFLI